MKQTQNTRVVSGGTRRGSSVYVLAGERKGSGSHSGEWGGSGVLSCAREKAIGRQSLACNWAGPRQDGIHTVQRNTETVAKQKQPPSAGLDTMHARGARPEDHVSTNY